VSWRPVAACAAVLLALGCARAPRPECVPDPPPGVVGSVCGFRNPEDVAAVPSAGILLVSQMRHDDSEQGGSIAALPLGVDGAPAGPPRTLWPPASPEQRAETAGSGAVGEAGCTAAPSAKRFAPHGISVGLPRADGSLPVAVVAHDPREAIELFELIPTGGAHRLRWSGCVPLPPGTTGNDVALAPDGSLLVTNFTPRSSGPVAIYDNETPRGGWAEILLLAERLDKTGNPTGGYLIALDAIGAGQGETVLILDEGNGARQILEDDQAPVRSMVVGIVDAVELASS